MTTTTKQTERQTGLVPQAYESLRKATEFLQEWSTSGGFPGGTSLDGTTRWGESKVHRLSPTQIWIQPPGTPIVGELFLRAWRITGDDRYMDAAFAVGGALVRTQHVSGGWALVDDTAGPRSDGSCSFDDNTTQAALQFLMHLEHEFTGRPWLTCTVARGIDHMLRAQYPNGSWPLWYPLKDDFTRLAALNDYCLYNCIKTMLEAHRLYRAERYLKSALRGGNFIIASQLSAPQEGWAQQYDYVSKSRTMDGSIGTVNFKILSPAWGRHFEPPAVCSTVTAGCIQSLIKLYKYTGEPKWLAPIPAAIDWLERTCQDRLPPEHGSYWPRFLELGSNRPISAEHNTIYYDLYRLSPALRKSYAWEGAFGIPAAIRAFKKIQQARREGLKVLYSIKEQDDQGRWLAPGGRELHVETFVDKMGKLLDYLEKNNDS